MKTRKSIIENAKFRTDENDQGQKIIEGYFIVFNQFTNLFDEVYEQVTPLSVDNSINSQDIRALYNHDTGKVLGRTKNGTLTLTKDDYGVYGKIIVNEDDNEALSVWAKIKRGDVSQASFGFMINDEDFQETNGGYYITLKDITIFEISVVTFPAYPTTDIKARNNDIMQMKSEKLNQRRNSLIDFCKKE